MKLLILTALTLFAATSGVLADKTLIYSCYNKQGADKVANERKTGAVVGDPFADKMIKNMPVWSGHKYIATHDWNLEDVIRISCSQRADSSEQAQKNIGEQQWIVKEHILKEAHGGD